MADYTYLIKKMLQGKLDASERIQLSEAPPMEELLLEQWDEESGQHIQDNVSSEEIWNKIAGSCWPAQEDCGKEKDKEKREDKGKGKFWKLNLTVGYSIAAAVVVLLVGVWIAQTINDSYLTFTAPAHDKMVCQLPDSSTIWLNAGSRISYPKRFLNNRTVKLDGEAYFNVRKKADSPFKVHFQKACIEVKGTEFNVRLNPEEALITLFTGKIVFNAEGQAHPIEMKPAEQLTYDLVSHRINLSKIAPEEYDWRTDEYHFEKKPFGELLQFINRLYEVNIVVKDSRIGKELFSGKIRKSESLHDVLNKICISFDLQQKREDDKLIVLY